MPPQFILQFLILSIGVNFFILFIYLYYYAGMMTATINADFEKQYDYVIVGAGTAGSVLAHRLATETNYSFIVLEAGGNSNLLFEIPVLGPLLHGSVYDWNYETTPQAHACFAMNNKKCKLTHGKIVGGSSKLNNMIHFRGNLSIYADWFHGKFDKHYFQTHFNYIENEILHLNEMQYDSELATNILEAAKELGYDIFSTGFKEGFSKVKLSQNNGRRWTISDNLNLFKHVIPYAFVDELIIVNNTAKGIRVDIGYKKEDIITKNGIILAAGAYNTPKILQLSGIGPSDILAPLDIPLVKDLPVGKNLQDHVTTGFDLILFNKTLTVNPFNMLNIFNVFEYFVKGTGPLTTAGCEILGFLSTKGNKTPDIQFMVMPVGISADRGSYLRVALGINDTVWENYFKNVFDKHAATILPIVLHPKGRGEIFITSKDPKVAPSINPSFLSDDDDVTTLINGLKLIEKFLNTTAMKQMGAFINSQPFPGCENYVTFSDQYWECYIRQLTLTAYHPVGTCSMGLSSSNSVVDTSFKVFGVDNLFVADASVLPTMPSGNINAAVAMMASIFFEENIKAAKSRNRLLQCLKTDFLFEYCNDVCMV